MKFCLKENEILKIESVINLKSLELQFKKK